MWVPLRTVQRWCAPCLALGFACAAAWGDPTTQPTTIPATNATAPTTSTASTDNPSSITSVSTTRVVSTQSTSAPASRPVAVDQLTPRGAIKVLDTAIASGDAKTIINVIQADNPQQARVVEAYANNRAALIAMREALWAEFPPAQEDRDKLPQRLTEVLTEVDGWEENIDGDSASVGQARIPAGERLKLRRVNQLWKVLFSSAFSPASPDLNQSADVFNVETKVFSQLTADLAAGKYKSMEEFERASPQVMQTILAAATQPTATPPATVPSARATQDAIPPNAPATLPARTETVPTSQPSAPTATQPTPQVQ